MPFAILPLSAPDWLTSIWGPATTLTPTIALIICIAAVLQGQRRLFLPATASACAAVASHIGGLPLVAPLWLLGALAFLRCSNSARRRAIVLPLLLIFGLFFALPLLEILTTEKYGNLGKFLRFLNKPRPILGFENGLSFIWNILTQRLTLAPPVSSNSLPLLIIPPIIIAAPRWRTMFGRLSGPLLLCSLLGWIGLVFAASRIVAEPQTYLVWVMWSLVTTTMLGLLVWALHTPLLSRPAARAVFGVLSLTILIVSLFYIQRPFDQEPRDHQPTNRFIQNLPTPVEVLPAKRGEWDAAAMVLRALLREQGGALRGKICIPWQWYFMYRRTLECPEKPKSIVLVWRTKKTPLELTKSLQAESYLQDALVTVVAADPAAVEAADKVEKTEDGVINFGATNPS